MSNDDLRPVYLYHLSTTIQTESFLHLGFADSIVLFSALRLVGFLAKGYI